MSEQVPLYNICLSQAELVSLIAEIRSTSYIDEVESGEESREDSSLYNIILPVKDIPSDTSVDSLIKHAGSEATALIIVNEKSMKSLLVVEIFKEAKVDEMRVVPKDVLEVLHNLMASDKMTLAEFKSMSKGAVVFDSGR